MSYFGKLALEINANGKNTNVLIVAENKIQVLYQTLFCEKGYPKRNDKSPCRE